MPSQYQKPAENRFNAALTKKIHLNRQNRIFYLRQSGFTESFYTASLQSREMLTRLPFALGPLVGHRLAIDVPALTLALGSLIRSDVLTAYPYPAKIWTPETVAA